MLKEIKKAINNALLTLDMELMGRYVDKPHGKPCIFTDYNIVRSEYTSERRCEHWISVRILLHTPNRDEIFLFEKTEELLHLFKNTSKTELGYICIFNKEHEIDTDSCYSLCELTLRYITYTKETAESMQEVAIRNGGKEWDYKK